MSLGEADQSAFTAAHPPTYSCCRLLLHLVPGHQPTHEQAITAVQTGPPSPALTPAGENCEQDKTCTGGQHQPLEGTDRPTPDPDRHPTKKLPQLSSSSKTACRHQPLHISQPVHHHTTRSTLLTCVWDSTATKMLTTALDLCCQQTSPASCTTAQLQIKHHLHTTAPMCLRTNSQAPQHKHLIS